MYRGKRERKVTHVSKKAALLVLSMVLILSVSVSGTLAYLIRSTKPVENAFVPGKVTTTIVEDFNPDGQKRNVKIENVKNDGSLPVYVRANVVLCWVDSSGNVLADTVTEDMISMDWGTNWSKIDEKYWYYGGVLMPGTSTSNLIDSCAPKEGAGPLNAHLQVTILSQSIQAYGNKDAVTEAWGATVANELPDAVTASIPTNEGTT